jgi:hypothetical protein
VEERWAFDKITGKQCIRTHPCVRQLTTDINNSIDIYFTFIVGYMTAYEEKLTPLYTGT